ncbi:MAG TPA: class I SAM-dependent rRNA methyltransferase [Bacteroidales bacterium]|nr:class I SAM-dependent rRNA methyltransferase [Bacteroidales bacterium]HRZ48639.1 class I SAM-dependent rRNA methyltransferase [Bacteroidales bacterium]
MTARIVLKAGKDESVKRLHPWVFSGAVKGVQGSMEHGDWVEVLTSRGEFLACGHYQHSGSITVRILTWEKEEPDVGFWRRKIEAALNRRIVAGIANRPDLNAWRLVFAEGDQLSGLIIDCYDHHFVVQCHSAGMERSLPLITEALREVFGEALKSIAIKAEAGKSDNQLPLAEFPGAGETTGAMITEYGCKYLVNWKTGQKTGFFLDQRENRRLLGNLAKGKKVLNTFCYTGGFSLAALQGGASLVHSVDSSAPAIELLRENLELNGYDPALHQAFVSDTQQFLKNPPETYDIIILDPPAYAKHLSARHNAIQGYRRLNAAALQILPPGGLLMTFSCSQVVDRRMFEGAVMAAALDTGRRVTILQRLVQPADHPVSLFHPEGEYLKGLLLMAE